MRLFVCVCVCDEVVSGQCRMSVAWRIKLTQSANVKELQNMMAAQARAAAMLLHIASQSVRGHRPYMAVVVCSEMVHKARHGSWESNALCRILHQCYVFNAICS